MPKLNGTKRFVCTKANHCGYTLTNRAQGRKIMTITRLTLPETHATVFARGRFIHPATMTSRASILIFLFLLVSFVASVGVGSGIAAGHVLAAQTISGEPAADVPRGLATDRITGPPQADITSALPQAPATWHRALRPRAAAARRPHRAAIRRPRQPRTARRLRPPR